MDCLYSSLSSHNQTVRKMNWFFFLLWFILGPDLSMLEIAGLDDDGDVEAGHRFYVFGR